MCHRGFSKLIVYVGYYLVKNPVGGVVGAKSVRGLGCVTGVSVSLLFMWGTN